MNRYQVNKAGNTEIGAVGTVDKIVRTVVGFGGLLAIVAGVATSPIQYFVLSCLGIYLVHTAIIGLDPFYAAARYLKSASEHKFDDLPISSASAH